jgi:hypothetical protein
VATGYCPNCGQAVEHDGANATCERCNITWQGGAAHALKPEPYEPGELEAIHAAHMAEFEARQERDAPSV